MSEFVSAGVAKAPQKTVCIAIFVFLPAVQSVVPPCLCVMYFVICEHNISDISNCRALNCFMLLVIGVFSL